MTQFNICFNCEYTLREPHKFCPNCGAQLERQIPTPLRTNSQLTGHQLYSKESKSSGFNLLPNP